MEPTGRRTKNAGEFPDSFPDLQTLEVAAGKAKVVEFFYGDPDPSVVELARGHGASLVSW